MTRVRGLTVSALLAVPLIALGGCAPMTLPAYDTVRDETRAAMQRVMDEFPADAPGEFLPDGTPFACGGSDGVLYTGQAQATPPAGFDGAAFIAGLPEALGSGFVEEDLGVDTSFPNVDLRAADYGDTGLSVSVITVDDVTTLGITATSRCAQPPGD